MYTVDRERVVDGERFPYDVDICLAEELMRAHARKRGVELGSTSGKGTRNVFEEVRLALAARARGSSRDPDLPHPSGRRPDASRATPESGRVRGSTLGRGSSFGSPSSSATTRSSAI